MKLFRKDAMLHETLQGRDLSIYFLKFLAVFFITNSHFGNFYLQYPVLATGGAIGDALFFFCSGYTIFIGRNMRFDNWYKRRISRIYPAVFAWAFIAAAFFGSKSSFTSILLYGGGWFVTCIMVYYAILYPIKVYCRNYLPWLMVLSLLAVVAFYVVIIEDKTQFKLFSGDFKYYVYFPTMLLGAIIGLRRAQFKSRPLIDFIGLIASVIVFYGVQLLAPKIVLVSYIQPIAVIPLVGIVFFFWKLMNAPRVLELLKIPAVRYVVIFVGGLCLEIYLSQMLLIHWLPPFINGLYPWNIPVAALIILVMGYVTHILAQWFSQTFKSENYCWPDVFIVR